MLGTLRPSDFSRQRIDHLRHVVQRKFLVLRRGQDAAPGIEQHHGLRAGGDLRVQIQNRRLGEKIEQAMQFPRRFVHHSLDLAEGLAAAAFDHVRSHGPRAAREADQGHPPAQFAAHQGDRVDHVLEFPPGVGHDEPIDVGRRADRVLEPGTFAGLEFQPQVHRMRNRENVREQDGGIERKSVDGLQGDLARDLGVGAHLEKAAGPLPRRAVFRQIAARLAHEPNRPARRRFAQQGAQQQIVGEGRVHDVQVRSAGSNNRRCSRMAYRSVIPAM